MARRETSRTQRASVAGGEGPDLWPGKKMLPAAQARARHACDASWDRGCSSGRFAALGLLWTLEHGFY